MDPQVIPGSAVSLTALGRTLYALRSDGAVFVLLRRGDISPDGREVVDAPHWLRCPAVPGTVAALEQEG